MSITIQNNASEQLQSYAVAIAFDTTTFDFSKAASDGTDLDVWDAQSKLPVYHWLEAFDPAAGKGLMWVKLTSLASGSEQTLWLTAGPIPHCDPHPSNGYQVFPFFSDVEGMRDWTTEGPLGLTDQDVVGPLHITDRRVIQSDGMYNGAPGVAQAANGDWVLAYRKGTDHTHVPFVVLRRSQDQGQTWTPEQVYFDTSGPDPSLARTPGGDLLIEFAKKDPNNISGAAYSRSIDNGLTWGAFTFYDQPVNNTNAFPTVFLNDGPVMYAAGYGPAEVDTGSAPSLWVSTDDGFTWSKRSTLRGAGDPGMSETAIAELAPGSLISISRADDGLNTFGQFSSDMGFTWGPPLSYTPEVGRLHLPQLAQSGPALILFGREAYFFSTQLVAYVSYDGGQSFAYGTVLDQYLNNPIDGGYCWPLLLPDGRIVVVYYSDTLGLRLPDIKSLVLQVGAPQQVAANSIHLVSHFGLANAMQDVDPGSNRYALDFRFRSHATPAGDHFAVLLQDRSVDPPVDLVTWDLPLGTAADSGFRADGQLVPLFSNFTFDHSYRLRSIVDEGLGQQAGQLLDQFGGIVSVTSPQPLAQGVPGHSNQLVVGNNAVERNTDTLLDFIFLHPVASAEPSVGISRVR